MSRGVHRRASSALLRLLTRSAVVLSVSVVGATALAGVARADVTNGSNGTVKVDGVAFDDGLGNEPHVGCTFQLDFYGFDVGTDSVDVTFTAQPPSGQDTTVSPVPGGGLTSFTMQGTGPGNDLDVPDAQQTYQLDTSGLTEQPQQGFHIKITTAVTNAAGVVTTPKQKVIWVDACTPPAPPALVAPALAGVCDAATGRVAWTVTNTNDSDLTGSWAVVPSAEHGSVTAPANSTGTFASSGGAATVTFADAQLTAGPVTVDCTPPPVLVNPTLGGVCDTTSGHVTWTVTNPNATDLTGTWTVTPGGETGPVTAAHNSTGTFVSTAGGTANVSFGDSGLTAGPVHVGCTPPPLSAPRLAGACDTTTGLVTWTLTNPNDTALAGVWASGSRTGTVSAPAHGSSSFTTSVGSVSVTFPAATGLTAVTGTKACVEAVRVHAPAKDESTPTASTPTPKPKPVTEVLGERIPRTLESGSASSGATVSQPATSAQALTQRLPFTGARSAGLVPYALGMVLAGMLLVVAGRRRRA
jgi:hypothetical protein